MLKGILHVGHMTNISRITENSTHRKIAVKEEIAEMLCVEYCILWIDNLDYEKEGMDVYGKLGDVVLETNHESREETDRITNEEVYR